MKLEILQRTQGGGGGFVPGKFDTLDKAVEVAKNWLTPGGYVGIYQGNKQVFFEGNRKEYELNNRKAV